MANFLQMTDGLRMLFTCVYCLNHRHKITSWLYAKHRLTIRCFSYLCRCVVDLFYVHFPLSWALRYPIYYNCILALAYCNCFLVCSARPNIPRITLSNYRKFLLFFFCLKNCHFHVNMRQMEYSKHFKRKRYG